MKSSSSLHKLDSYLSVASYKVNVLKIQILEGIFQKNKWENFRERKNLLESHRVREYQAEGQWQWGSHFSWAQFTQDKKERGGYKPGWVVSNPEPVVTDLTDNLLLKILRWKRPDTYFA